MKIRLFFKEIVHRKINFILSLLAITVAVAFFIAFLTAGKASDLETRKIMLGMGQNLRIIPRETAMDQFWLRGYSEYSMPEEYVYRFAKYKGFSYTHLTATLQKMILWRGKKVILTGILPEVFPPDKLQQKPMTFSIKPGTVYVGHELAVSLNIKKGNTIEILGSSFEVIKCLPQSGSTDDIRMYGHLHDIQKLVDMEGRINEIKALECLCLIETGKIADDPFLLAKKQLQQILPQAKVVLLQGIAQIRQRQRAMIEGYLEYITPVLLIVSFAWVGILVMLNVRDRRQEIGILRAVGYSSGRIAALFLGKAIFLGLLGAVIGFVIGTCLSLQFGPDIFKITANKIKPVYGLLLWSMIAAPAFSALAAFVPSMIAIAQDPAQILREE